MGIICKCDYRWRVEITETCKNSRLAIFVYMKEQLAIKSFYLALPDSQNVCSAIDLQHISNCICRTVDPYNPPCTFLGTCVDKHHFILQIQNLLTEIRVVRVSKCYSRSKYVSSFPANRPNLHFWSIWTNPEDRRVNHGYLEIRHEICELLLPRNISLVIDLDHVTSCCKNYMRTIKKWPSDDTHRESSRREKSEICCVY